jgi:hypothetical protein
VNKKPNAELNSWNILCNSLMIKKESNSNYSHSLVSMPIPFPRSVEFSETFNSKNQPVTLIEFIKGRIVHLFFSKSGHFTSLNDIEPIFYDNFGNDLSEDIKLNRKFTWGDKTNNLSITFVENNEELFLYSAMRTYDFILFSQEELDALAVDLGVRRPKVWKHYDLKIGTSTIENKNKIFNFMAIDEFNEHCMITCLTEKDKISINNLEKEELIDIWKSEKESSAKRYNSNCVGFYKQWEEFCSNYEKTIHTFAIHHFRYPKEEIRKNLKDKEEWIISLITYVCYEVFTETNPVYAFDQVKFKIRNKMKEVSSEILLKSFWDFINKPTFESAYDYDE